MTRFTLPDLPYDLDALEPHISKTTLEYHYGKHHQAYVDKLNAQTEGTDLTDEDLEGLIIDVRGNTEKQKLFNAAAQVWNHTLYWHSMSPNGGGEPGGRLADLIIQAFGSHDAFVEAFKKEGAGEFGSGWVWLVHTESGLAIESTTDAEVPTADLDRLLLTMDVWEHAYYLDTQNDRGAYMDAFLGHLVNWENAAVRLEAIEKELNKAA